MDHPELRCYKYIHFSHSSTIPRNNQGTMNAQDSSSLHRSNTPLLNNFNRSDLNDNKKDYHMVKPDSEDASKAVSNFYNYHFFKSHQYI